MSLSGAEEMGNDRYAPIKRLAASVRIQPPRNPSKPPTSFLISDILNRSERTKSDIIARSDRELLDRAKVRFNPLNAMGVHGMIGFLPGHRVPILPAAHADGRGIIRPWDDDSSRSSTPYDEDEEIDVEDEKPPKDKSQSPLDALLKMTSKTFDGKDPSLHLNDPSGRDQLSLFAKTPAPKKRRKSRTAFTNQQIYELEKRFLYQKYLTPADRDEIAQQLGLSNAQVITWFQNRRAKLKRDLEELKNDVTAAKSVTSDDESAVVPLLLTQMDEAKMYKQKEGLTPPRGVLSPSGGIPQMSPGIPSRELTSARDLQREVIMQTMASNGSFSSNCSDDESIDVDTKTVDKEV